MTDELQKDRASQPDPIDIHVGARLRLRRNLVGMSQEQLGKASSLTFQQIQKYEHGTNRISASRLYRLGLLLGVPVSYFYNEMPPEITATTKPPGFGENEQAEIEGMPKSLDDELVHRRETMELIRVYYAVTSQKKRRSILDLIKSMSE